VRSVAPDAACRAWALVSCVCSPRDDEGGLLVAAYHSSRRLGNCALIRAALMHQLWWAHPGRDRNYSEERRGDGGGARIGCESRVSSTVDGCPPTVPRSAMTRHMALTTVWLWRSTERSAEVKKVRYSVLPDDHHASSQGVSHQPTFWRLVPRTACVNEP